MLNKFTLTFRDDQFERVYQEYLTINIRKPLLLKLVVNTIAFLIMSLIQKTISGTEFLFDFQYLLIFSGNLVQVMFFLLIYYKKQELIKWAILFYNHILLFYYYNSRLLKPQEQILTSIGIICLQIVNGLSGEFFEGVYQVIAFTSVYAYFGISQDNTINYQLIVQILSASLILISAIYQNIKALRSQFQLCNIDNLWEQIFMTLIKDQYIVFQYHEYEQCFKLKNEENSQYMRNTQELRQFLREAKIQKQITLEQYIFSKIKNNSEQKNIISEAQMIKLPDGSKTKISYSIFYGIKIIIFIKLLNGSYQKKSKQYSIEKMYQYRYKRFLILLEKLIFQNKQNLHEMAYQIRKFCLYAHLKDFFYLSSLSKYFFNLNCKSIAKTLQSIYFNKIITYENYITTEITGCKQVVMIVLIEIIERSLSQFISLSFESNNNESFSIKIYCLYEEQKKYLISQEINKYLQTIISYSFQHQCILIVFKQRLKSQDENLKIIQGKLLD